jgi:hypothetical protein
MSQTTNYNEPTKVTSESFYNLLCAIYETPNSQHTADKQSNDATTKWSKLHNHHNRQNTQPTLEDLKRHYGIGIGSNHAKSTNNNTDTTEMSNILEIIANTLPSYERNWEMMNVLRSHIVMRKKTVTNPYIKSPMKSQPTTNDKGFTTVQGRKSAKPSTTATESKSMYTEAIRETNAFELLVEKEDGDDDEAAVVEIYNEKEKSMKPKIDNRKQEEERIGMKDERKKGTKDEMKTEETYASTTRKKDMINTIKLGNINDLSIDTLEQYITDTTMKCVQDHQYKITNTLNTSIQKIQTEVYKQMNFSVTNALTTFNNKASTIMEQNLATIATKVTELKRVEEATRQSTVKMQANIEMIEAGALIKYKADLDKIITSSKTDIISETKLQRRLITQFIKEQGDELQRIITTPDPIQSTPPEDGESNDSNSAIKRVQASLFPLAQLDTTTEFDNLAPGTIVLLKKPFPGTKLMINTKFVDETKTVNYTGISKDNLNMTIKTHFIDYILQHESELPQDDDDETTTEPRMEEENMDDNDYGINQNSYNSSGYKINRFAKGPSSDKNFNHRDPHPLSHNQFKFHNEYKHRTVEQHYITKYAKDWNIRLHSSKQNTEPFYKDLKTHLTQYNVLLLDYHDITRSKGIEFINSTNCDNYENAKAAMSRALYVMFLTNKDTMFTSKYHKDLLLNYEDEENGLAFLKELISPHHLALKLKSETEGTTNQPDFTEGQTIFEYIRSYKRWVREEKQAKIPREYSDMDNAANIRKQMEKHEKYSIPTEHLKNELTKVENKQKEFPQNLKLNNIALTLFNKIPPEERFEDDNDTAHQGVTINKVATRSQRTSNYNKDKHQGNGHDKKYNRYNKASDNSNASNHQSAGDTETRRSFDPTKKCKLCGMYGHDGLKGDGCDATATHMNVTKAVDTLTYTQKKSIKDKWIEYQNDNKTRRLKNRKGRNILRDELRRLQVTETPEDYISLKKFTVNTYKTTYPLEDWNDPYADSTNGISDYEDIESDESEDEAQQE